MNNQYCIQQAALITLAFVKLCQWYSDFDKAKQCREQQEEAVIHQAVHTDLDQENEFYSTVFEGKYEEEKKKRKIIQIMEDSKEKVRLFIQKFDFKWRIDKQEVCKYLEENHIKGQETNLQIILDPTKNFFSSITNVDNSVNFLNGQIQDLFELIMNFFQEQFNISGIQEEYSKHYLDLFEIVYHMVKHQAKYQQKQLFHKLIEPLKQYVNQVDQTCKKFCSLNEFNKFKQFIYQSVEEYKYFLGQQYGFEINILLFHKYQHKLIQKCLRKLKYEYELKINQYIDDKIYQQNFKDQINNLFSQFIRNGNQHGICDREANENLQYLIYSIDWSLDQKMLGKVQELLFHIAKEFTHVFLLKSGFQKSLGLNQDTILNFRNNNQKCATASQWWKDKISESFNFRIIFQIYCIIANIQVIDGKLYIGQYGPTDRILLTKILRVLNNGNFNYHNFIVLKACEEVTHQLQHLIYNAIQQKFKKIKLNLISEQELSEPLLIKWCDHQLKLLLYNENNDQIQAQKKFLQKNDFFFKIISPVSIKGQIIKDAFTEQSKILEKELKVIHDNIDQFSVKIPFLQFELISDAKNNSNVITLVIAGFNSKNENKYDYWKHLLTQGSGTVIALHWDTKELMEFYNCDSAKDYANSNPYINAYNEAIKVGAYLGCLIGEHLLFGERQINLIVHSLGSVVMFSCIRMLDKIYLKQTKKHINQILMVGGAVDVRKLKKRRWNSVAGKIHNVYIKNDKVLSKFLKFITKYDKPIGLESIQLSYTNILNHNMTGIVQGHTDYNQQIAQIVAETDFNNDIESIIIDKIS